MIISKIDVFNFDLSYAHGTYVMSGGREITTLQSTLVRVISDSGIAGWGEVCPLGTTYLPAHVGGVRAALELLAPPLIGLNPTNHAEINDAMDRALMGYASAKSPIDVACWDLTGKAWDASVADMLGGIRQRSFPLYFAVPLASPDAMRHYVNDRRAEGIHRFQLKIGGDPALDAARARTVVENSGEDDIIIGDANCGWRLNEAIQAARAMEDLPRFYFEQPCPTMEECIEVRKQTTLPMIYDEVVNDVATLLRANREGGAGGFNLKISKLTI